MELVSKVGLLCKPSVMWILTALHRVFLAALLVSFAFAPVGAATLRDVSDQAVADVAKTSAMTDCLELAKVRTGCTNSDCGSAAACEAHCGLSVAVFGLRSAPVVFQAFSRFDPAVIGRFVLFGPLVPDPRPPRA